MYVLLNHYFSLIDAIKVFDFEETWQNSAENNHHGETSNQAKRKRAASSDYASNEEGQSSSASKKRRYTSGNQNLIFSKTIQNYSKVSMQLSFVNRGKSDKKLTKSEVIKPNTYCVFYRQILTR